MKQVAVYIDEREDQWKLIKKMWKKLCIDGGFPHFLFEDMHILIRYCDNSHDYVEKVLKKYKTVYDEDWIEGNAIVRENERLFETLFHIMSNYAITKAKGTENTFEFLERVYHCTFNMLRANLIYEDGRWISESRIYGKLCRMWSFSEGYLFGRLERDKQ